MIEAWTAAAIVTGVGMCVVDQLQNTPESGGTPPKMRIVLMTPGNIAWDSCDCGQFAQTIQSDYPSTRFPQETTQDAQVGGCKFGPLAVQVLASITRCTPTFKSNTLPTPPTPTALLTSALQFEGDAYALRVGIECCLADYKKQRRIANFTVGRVNRVGPEGACGGPEVQYWFLLT